MLETLFGSGAPMWTGMPSTGFGFQPTLSLGSRGFNAPFGSAALPGMSAAMGANPQTAGGSLFFGVNPAPMIGTIGPLAAEPMGGVTAAGLLTAVALRRGQPQGPTNDQEVEDFIYDALELLPGASDVEVRCEGGRVTLTGSVQHKRIKRDVGEIAWAIPVLHDVQNNVTIASRRRVRAAREADAPATPARKQA